MYRWCGRGLLGAGPRRTASKKWEEHCSFKAKRMESSIIESDSKRMEWNFEALHSKRNRRRFESDSKRVKSNLRLIESDFEAHGIELEAHQLKIEAHDTKLASLPFKATVPPF